MESEHKLVIDTNGKNAPYTTLYYYLIPGNEYPHLHKPTALALAHTHTHTQCKAALKLMHR